MTNRIPVAFAVTYLIGVVGAAWFLAQLAPRIMGIDLGKSAGATKRRCRAGRQGSGRAGHRISGLRGAAGSPLIGRRVRELEGRAQRLTLFVERIRRRGPGFSTPTKGRRCRTETRSLSRAAGRLLVADRRTELGVREVDDPELLEIPAEAVDVVVTRRRHRRSHARRPRATRNRAQRVSPADHAGRHAGSDVPGDAVQRGDVVTLVGPTRRVAQAGPHRCCRPGDRLTDMVLVAFGIVAGALVGLPR